jgi:hypothetical protein
LNPRLFYFVVIVVSTIWVAVDANKLGMRRGRLRGGVLDMGVASWTICCLFLWIVSFPCYLVARSKYRAMQSFQTNYQGATFPPQSWQPAPNLPVAWQAASVHDPTQISPDGRWWWNGQQWIPMPPPTG